MADTRVLRAQPVRKTAQTLQRVLTDLAVHPGVRDERPGAAIYPCEHESCLEIEEQQYLAEDL